MKKPHLLCTVVAVFAIASGVILSGIVQKAAGQPSPSPHPNCKKTDIGPKCGTDVVLSSTQCDSSVSCVLDEHVYEPMMNCSGGGQGGLKLCCASSCRVQKITRACSDNGDCIVLVGNHFEDVLPSSRACGDPCGNTTSQPSEPVDPMP